MRLPHLASGVVFAAAIAATAQNSMTAPYQISAGYSYISNTMNGTPGKHQPLQGYAVAVASPAWHNLRFAADYEAYRGTNQKATQSLFIVMAGPHYQHRLGPETLFAKALAGGAGANRDWAPGGKRGGTASIVTYLGGGFDTPIRPHWALRAEGGFAYMNFPLLTPALLPYRADGLPNFFGRFSAGLVWLPEGRSSGVSRPRPPPQAPESEIFLEAAASAAHYKLLASSKWTYLHVAGVEYDRNSWGRFLGARWDYVAEFLPVAILVQPAKPNPWGIPRNKDHSVLAAVGFSPIGTRLLWRDEKAWSPFFEFLAGLLVFDQKALTASGAYEQFSLQHTVGLQVRMKGRWDLRASVSDFHFSNGFVVPYNPGTDDMMLHAGLVYHLTGKRARR